MRCAGTACTGGGTITAAAATVEACLLTVVGFFLRSSSSDPSLKILRVALPCGFAALGVAAGVFPAGLKFAIGSASESSESPKRSFLLFAVSVCLAGVGFSAAFASSLRY